MGVPVAELFWQGRDHGADVLSMEREASGGGLSIAMLCLATHAEKLSPYLFESKDREQILRRSSQSPRMATTCSLYPQRRSLIIEMRSLRQLGALILLLVMSVAPAMACMVPDAQMSTQERECCRMMKDQCGQIGMSASHGCCQKAPQSTQINALATKTVAFHPVVVLAIWQAAAALLNPTTVVSEWLDRPEYSPPKSPPTAISILRI